ncbi:hypothetical protein Tco_0824963, partial [Tanacetum coccineum]
QLLMDYLIDYIEEKQKSMDIESICAAAGTVVGTDVTTWSSLP